MKLTINVECDSISEGIEILKRLAERNSGPPNAKRILDMYLNTFETDVVLTEKQVMKWAIDANLKTEDVKNWIREQVRNGWLVREADGNFRRTQVQS